MLVKMTGVLLAVSSLLVLGADAPKPVEVKTTRPTRGDIVRYFEAGETASYFGSIPARSTVSGLYEPARESRMIASTGKIIAAIALANEGKDNASSLYLDTQAPAQGLDPCAKGGNERYGRKAIVAFACSLNNPLLNRTALVGQTKVQHIIDGLGFTMPPPSAEGEQVPASTAAVLGQISGSPRRVHHMAGVVLASLLGQGGRPVKLPTLVKSYDYIAENTGAATGAATTDIVPNTLINRGAAPFIKTLLQSPLCYAVNGAPAGTLKSLSEWCAARRSELRFHFAKTGTQVTTDPNATVDNWITGGLQFQSGAAYSYVILVGTGSGSQPWGTSLHAAQIAAPLAEVLLTDLSAHAKSNPEPRLLPQRAAPAPLASAAATGNSFSGKPSKNETTSDTILQSLR